MALDFAFPKVSSDAYAPPGEASSTAVVDDGIEETERRMVAKVWADFAEARTDRLQKDYEWWVCWRWYNGYTDTFFDATAARSDGQVYRVSSNTPRHRRNRPINLIGHSIDLLIAKQMKARPTFDARSGGTDMRKRLAARAARDFVRHIWLERDLTSRRRDLFLDRNITGNAFMKCFYDPLIAPFADNMQPCPSCGGRGQVVVDEMTRMQMWSVGMEAPAATPCTACKQTGQVKMGRKALGDVDLPIISPWEIWPIRGAKKVEQGVFHSYPMSKEAAAARYGFAVDEIKPSASIEEGESDFARMARERRISWSKEREDTVYVVERWMPPAPGTEHPRLTVLVGNRLAFPRPGMHQGWETAEAAGYPIAEPYCRIPIFHFRLRPSAEEFWSGGIVVDMIAANDFVNRSRANHHAHQKKMAYVKWTTEMGSVNADAITDEEAEVIEYRGVEPPKQQSPAPMPEYYLRLQEMEENNIPKIAGLQDIDQGKAPPNVEAFQALHFLAEQSETIHGPVLLDDETQWRNIANAALVCARANYKPTDQRLTRIGSSTSLEVKYLIDAELSDSTVIVCEIGSALVHSLALRQEQVMRAMESPNPIIKPTEARRLMEWGVMLGEDDDDHRMQESVAVTENETIAQGGQHYVLSSAHDHECHIEMHKRAALDAQMAGDIELAMLFNSAVEQHKAALAYEAMMGMPAPTGPTGPGGPPGQGPPRPGSSRPFDSRPQGSNYDGAGAAPPAAPVQGA